MESDLQFICVMLGGLPVIKNYEAQPISATIQPGSSGSAVFDSNGHIAGLVFAGSGDIGYGFVVPQEYVKYFVEEEVQFLQDQRPDTVLTADLSIRRKKIASICSTNINNITSTPKLKDVCDSIDRDMIYFSEKK